MKRYKSIDIKEKDRKKYYTNSIYPIIPESEEDIYIIASEGDRYDKLALQFYKDSSLWWLIAASNNHQRAALIPTPGEQIRIPADKNLALRLYKEINTSR